MTPLEAVLGARQSALVFGNDTPVEQVLGIVRELGGRVRELDWRGRVLGEAELRREMDECCRGSDTVAVLLAPQVTPQARAVLSEVLDGQLAAAGRLTRVEARLLAICADNAPDASLRALFATTLRGSNAVVSSR